jgi:hypothetical protein
VEAEKMLMIYSEKLIIVTWVTTVGREHKFKTKCGQRRRRLTWGLDTFGSVSSGRFLVAWPAQRRSSSCRTGMNTKLLNVFT